MGFGLIFMVSLCLGFLGYTRFQSYPKTHAT
jgi:hypothetical protein